jgi:hypothetical protein
MTNHNPFLVIFDMDIDTDTPEDKLKNALSWNNRKYKINTRVRRQKNREQFITCIVCKSTHTADYMRDHVTMKKHINNEAKFIQKTQLK